MGGHAGGAGGGVEVDLLLATNKERRCVRGEDSHCWRIR